MMDPLMRFFYTTNEKQMQNRIIEFLQISVQVLVLEICQL
jgi:hypothetical protein